MKMHDCDVLMVGAGADDSLATATAVRRLTKVLVVGDERLYECAVVRPDGRIRLASRGYKPALECDAAPAFFDDSADNPEWMSKGQSIASELIAGPELTQVRLHRRTSFEEPLCIPLGQALTHGYFASRHMSGVN